MGKDSYYFPHDSNAKDDPKCVLLIEQLGTEGYGIYWILIETLRDQPDYTYPVANIPALARRYNTSAEKVRTVVYNYELFAIKDDKIFFSESLIKRMIPWNRKRELARIAGKASAAKRLSINTYSTDVEHPLNDRSTIREDKRRVKRESIKRKCPTFSPPSLEEIQVFITEQGYTVDPQCFLDFYAAKGWMIGKNKMKDWRAAVRTWAHRPDHKNPESHEAATSVKWD